MFVRPINKFMALSAHDQILLLKLWALLCCVALLLRLLDFQRTRRLLERLSPPLLRHVEISETAMVRAVNLGRLTSIAGRYVPANATCLRQSLLVWWLLRRGGLQAELCIGVRKHPAFIAHAWVELDGQPINDQADVEKHFAAFERV